VIEQLFAVRDIYVNAPKKYELLKEAYESKNQETQDIMHVLELGSLNAVQLTKMSKELQTVRQERRKIKDELEVLEEIVRFVKRKPTEHEINTLIGNVRKIEEKKGRRYYTMRIRKDLQEFIK